MLLVDQLKILKLDYLKFMVDSPERCMIFSAIAVRKLLIVTSGASWVQARSNCDKNNVCLLSGLSNH
jgi:hypothetical protein